MADSSVSERTEQATPERIRKSREEGRIPTSQELPSALLLAGLLIATALTAPNLWHWSTDLARQGFSLSADGPMGIDSFLHILRSKITDAMWVMAPLLGAASVGGMLGSVLVGGWAFSPAAVKLNFQNLAPKAALKTLFSPRSAVGLVTSLAKLAVLGAISWLYLRDKLDACLALSSATPLAGLLASAQLVFGLVLRITVAMMAIGAADALYQRWQYKRDLRMSREEVREEHRQHEGSPLVKARMRAIHFAMVRKRMLKQVPHADVVVTNPTHVAVALKYDSTTMEAPVVLAKGAEKLCEKIKSIARQHNVPIIEKPELARALYDGAEVGQVIPEPLYVAVAEILAMIYRLRKQRQNG